MPFFHEVLPESSNWVGAFPLVEPTMLGSTFCWHMLLCTTAITVRDEGIQWVPLVQQAALNMVAFTPPKSPFCSWHTASLLQGTASAMGWWVIDSPPVSSTVPVQDSTGYIRTEQLRVVWINYMWASWWGMAWTAEFQGEVSCLKLCCFHFHPPLLFPAKGHSHQPDPEARPQTG